MVDIKELEPSGSEKAAETKKPVPFLTNMCGRLYTHFDNNTEVVKNEKPEDRHSRIMAVLKEKLRPFEAKYIAWESVRQNRGLLVTDGQTAQAMYGGEKYEGLTGFEGYFAGMHLTPEEIFTRISQMGEKMYGAYSQIHRISRENFLKQLDPKNRPTDLYFTDLEGIFAAELARSRAYIDNLPPPGKNYDRSANAAFRGSSFSNTSGVHLNIDFSAQDDKSSLGVSEFRQDLKFPSHTEVKSVHTLAENEAFGYAVMTRIGILGHPMFRLYMRMRDRL